MNLKRFTSASGQYCIALPKDWDEYDDDEENTHAFFNSAYKEWKGNLRITQFHRTDTIELGIDKPVEFLMSEFIENEGATRRKFDSFDWVHYKKDIIQDNEEFVIYYWAIGAQNDLFICSFTVAKRQVGTRENGCELETVENILKSININLPQ